MSIFTTEIKFANAKNVSTTEDSLILDLDDGRTITVPLGWYPRFFHGIPEERNYWRLIGGGIGIHWPDLDEDINVENLILAKRSGESQTSFQQWLDERSQVKNRSS